jgi:adenylosuccinate synthase
MPTNRRCSKYASVTATHPAATKFAITGGDAHWLEACQPVYIQMEGWMRPTHHIRTWDELPLEARNYVCKIEELVHTTVRYVSVGPERDATIIVP